MSAPDWSKLITVNYKGGLSGDFFCNLLQDNFEKYIFDKNYDSFNNKYFFAKRDFFNLKFKSLEELGELLKNNHYLNSQIVRNDANKVFNDYEKLITIYRDEPSELLDGLREIFLTYASSFKGYEYRVSNFHNCNSFIFSLQEIFPGSKNIVLSTNQSYYPLARILAYHKNIINKFDKTINIKDHSNFIDNQFFKMPDFLIHNEFKIDIYELIFLEKNYDEILSNYLNHQIKLDKKRINKYKNDHIDFFKKYNIDVYKEYSYEEMKQNIISVLREDKRFEID
jgi:hypothetical protein